MFESINGHLELPALYKETKEAFWDDDYISMQMLKAHLAPEFDGASRKLDFIEKSVSWINAAVPSKLYPMLLDIGCGPGLYAERFAKCGYRVTGVDISRRSIGYAQKSAQDNQLKIEYSCQNYLALDLDKQYDLATMIYCDYGALSTKNRRLVLQNIHRQLKPGGKLLLDVFSMEKYNAFSEQQTWETHHNGGFWREKEYIELNRNYKFSDHVTLEQITIISNADIVTYYLWNTCFTVNSLIEEVKQSGFEVHAVYGDVSGSRYSEESSTIAVLLGVL